MLRSPVARRTSALAAAAVASATGLATALPTPALASPSRASASSSSSRVIASGLDNPRHLAFRGGTLYVAEAGRGGHGPCVPDPEGGQECLGTTGALATISGGVLRRVVTGLPSLAGSDGSSAIGPSGVVTLSGGRVGLTIGGGGTPHQRSELGSDARLLSTLVVASHRGRTWAHPRVRLFADLSRFERSHNPDGRQWDSDPTGVTRRNGHFLVTDAAGNDLVRAGRGGTSALAVFPNRQVANPFGPGTVAMESVPTGVAKGPNGTVFVSELTGFPFPEGAARIYRFAPGQQPRVWATGLTNVTDIAWYRGHLYAVQLADHGLLAANGLPMGSLVRVDGGSRHHVVADHLQAPYGVATHAGAAYVTTCSVCAGGGSVVRIPLG